MSIELRHEVLKAKDKRLPNRVGMVASGPPELFSDDIRDKLAIAGFRKTRPRNESWKEAWRLPASVGALPDHLLHTLTTSGSVQGTLDVQNAVRRGVQATETLGAGGAELSVRMLGEFFCANCDLDNKHRRSFLEGAGWFPLFPDAKSTNPVIVKAFGDFPYVTKDGILAINLHPWMSAEAKTALLERMREEKLRIARSGAKGRIVGDPAVPMPEGERLQGFQDAGVNNLLRTRKSGVIYDDMGLGKAQPLDARVLTPKGWVRMGDIAVGDQVIGVDGRPTTVTAVYPQGEKEIFEVGFSDGSAAECCAEHLWAVSGLDGRDFFEEVLDLRQIRERMARGIRHEIPMMTAPDFAEADIGGTPEEVVATLGRGRPLPRAVRWASRAQRVAVLQALVTRYGDDRGQLGLDLAFGHDNDALAQSVIRLIQSLGGTAEEIGWSGESRLAIRLPKAVVPFADPERAAAYEKAGGGHPRRRIQTITPVGRKPAQCIAVDAPEHLYVTNDYIVTHNTVQGIAYANARPDLPRVLVVCKANMKYGWKTSFERFSTRPHNPFVIEGVSATITDPKTGEVRSATPRPETLIPAGAPAPEAHDMVDVVIINYDILTDHAQFIRNTVWDLILFDEIHTISNEEAQRTQAVFGNMKDKVLRPVGLRFSKKGVAVGLSGTPHPVIERMWPILSGLRPDLFGSGPIAKRNFINRYAPPTLFVKEFPNGAKRVMAIPGRPVRQAELNRRLRGSGFMTRRLKADMKDFLPPKTRAAIELPFVLTPEETKELAQLEGQIVEIAAKVAGRAMEQEAVVRNAGQAKAVIDVVQGLHPKSPEFHEISRLRGRIGEIKAPYVADYVLQEAEGEEDLPADIRPKTVIFAHHKTVVAAIRDALEARYPGQVIVYDGSVNSDKKRFELEKRFQTDNKVRFFVMSLSGASGITLTRANRLYMAEMDWDPTNLPQIEDRIWRMTQELPCFIGYFMIPNSLDVQMGNRLIQRMEDNRLIYDEVDLRPGEKRSPGAFTKKAPKEDAAQGSLF